MKTFVLLILFLCASSSSSIVWATSPSPAPTSGQKAEINEVLFTRQAQSFYKKHIDYLKKIRDEKKNIQKQLSHLTLKKNTAKDIVTKRKLEAQILELHQRLDQLAIDSAKHDVETAEFGMEVANHRLEVANRNLARVQSLQQTQKKK